MARASYIYVVKDGDEIKALFTVKWECFMWIDINGHPRFKVYRSRDGGKYEPVEIVELNG